jgi:SNF2 family DNA or RNA helicase
MAKIVTEGKDVLIYVPFMESYRAKNVPNVKWDRKIKAWRAPIIKATCRGILEEFADEISPDMALEFSKRVNHKPNESPFPPHVWKNPPKKHQLRALNKAWGKRNFAFFMRMRTGKTYTSLMWSERLYCEGSIDAIWVSCPTSVKDVWKEQIEEHCSVSTDVFVMKAGRNKAAKKFIAKDTTDLKVMIFGTESLSAGGAATLANEFTSNHNAMGIMDESHDIKNFKSTRTERASEIGSYCAYKCLLTGTPIAQGIEDLFSQYAFLTPAIIGMSSYYSFRNRYCIMGGYQKEIRPGMKMPTKIIGYNNVKELMELLSPYTVVVDTKEAFPNLPKRINEKLIVEPTKEQVVAMNMLKTEMMAIDGKDVIEIETALERMIRYQQIAGGHFPFNMEKGGYDIKPIKGKNPKMDAMVGMIERDANDQKYIIWAVFKPEIKLIAETLKKKFGEDSVVTFYGDTSTDDKTAARHRFQNDPACRFFVSSQAAGGKGIKLSAADIMIYYSNSFKYIDRDQSGERWIDYDRVDNMLVVDIVMNHKVDKDIYRALSRKEDVAAYVARSL